MRPRDRLGLEEGRDIGKDVGEEDDGDRGPISPSRMVSGTI